uniref:AlNc14C80G5283 protein n=1 Tax=Albugo laibachii Nc14 TaxID=890382 RepID=F0WF91_9STRA|nr:AlNc14C80G5283 [Albugo laibachii Nc14]|eukprot:CCA19873.1 AlNc14C80G5283 [Albugo laibachii Nc14]
MDNLVSNHRSAFDSQAQSTYSGIALVQFEYAYSRMLDCVTCLITHTDVIFVHKFGSTPGGYVWMRPAPSNILRRFLNIYCSTLIYHEHREQIVSHIKLRPQSEIFDIWWNIELQKVIIDSISQATHYL